MISPTTIDDNLSSFSDATLFDHDRATERSSISLRTRSNSQLENDLTDEFKDRYFYERIHDVYSSNIVKNNDLYQDDLRLYVQF
jgi:hypothetical protein